MVAARLGLVASVRLTAPPISTQSQLAASSSASASLARPRRLFHRGYATKPPSPPSPVPSQPFPPIPTAYEKQRRSEWLVIGVCGSVAAAGAYYWYQRRNSPAEVTDTDSTMAPSSNNTYTETRFAIPVRGPTGERTRKIITSLSPIEVDKRLKEHERSVLVADEIPGNHSLVYRYDTNNVASNDPIEDRRAEAIVDSNRGAMEGSNNGSQKSASSFPATPARGDLAFFAVMDGHSGFHTSSYLSQKLIAFVALELDKVFRETGEYSKMVEAKSAIPSKVWRALGGGSDSSGSSRLDGDPAIIRRAITKAFVGLDKEICNTPLELLKEYELSRAAGNTASSSGGSGAENSHSLSALAHSIFPSPGSSQAQSPLTATPKSAYESMLPALSGSCALFTYIDSLRNDIYVACTGDSRAIAGWFNPRDGKWVIEGLSNDQTGRSLSEVKRMQGEHPSSEADSVIMRGRVLGNLEPTRAFGDARYKWTKDTQERLYKAFLPAGNPSARPPPRNLLTPPYVTARPEVEWRRLPIAEGEKQLKFVVMATDGLWDMLSNEEVGTLVAGHLAELKGEVTSSELEAKFLTPAPTLSASGSAIGSIASSVGAAVSSAVTSSSSSGTMSGSTSSSSTSPISQQQSPHSPTHRQQQQRQEGHHPLAKSDEDHFTFQDSNLATHLVRNALGGADRNRVGALLAIPPPDARRYRDDITVNVILLKEPHATNVAGILASSPPPQSKL